MALILNGRPEEGVAPLDRALRLSPRDSFRAEWQYRLALTHFMLGHYELARKWGQTAQASNSSLLWPPIHAAAMVRLGQQAQATQVFDEFMSRNPKFAATHITARLPGTLPRFVQGREELVSALREAGLK